MVDQIPTARVVFSAPYDQAMKIREMERADRLNRGMKMQSGDYWDCPELYCDYHLRVKLWWKQRHLVRKMMVYPHKVLCRSAHSIGKSYLASCLASWHYDSWPKSYTIMTSATAKNTQDVIFAELRRRRPRDPHLLPIKPSLRESEDHWIEGYTTGSGESYSGRHLEHMMFQFDESTDIHPEVWKATYGMFIPNGKMYWLAWCNPIDPSSQFAIEELSGTWHIEEISQLQHPNIINQLAGKAIEYPGAAELAQVLDLLDSNSDQIPLDMPEVPGEIRIEYADGRVIRWYPSPEGDIRVMGRWAGTTGANVWSYRMFEKMEAMRHPHNSRYPIRIACDLAAYGDDDTVIMVMWGPRVCHMEKHTDFGPRQTRNRLKALCDHYAEAAGTSNEWHRGNPKSIPCVLDAGGDRHLAVCEYSDGYDFRGVNPSETAADEGKYYNKRSELWFYAAEEAGKNGAADISMLSDNDKQRLKIELTSPQYSLDTKMRKRVEDKKVTKARLRKSPDVADTFNLLIDSWRGFIGVI
jgi:hypothetical protein